MVVNMKNIGMVWVLPMISLHNTERAVVKTLFLLFNPFLTC